MRLSLPHRVWPLLIACACRTAPETEPERSAPGAPAAPTQPSATQPAAAPAPRSWTKTFTAPAVLVAREVRIEGPIGIRDHVALTIDASVHDYRVTTVPEGLLQELRLKPGVTETVLRCVLDSLQIAAEDRLVVLERPGDVPVVVLAQGDAVWRTPEGAEQRGETLRLVGEESR